LSAKITVFPPKWLR